MKRRQILAVGAGVLAAPAVRAQAYPGAFYTPDAADHLAR